MTTVIPTKTDVSDELQKTLRISETFFSLQGETSFSGWPTCFIRLTGCPLRCVWCDSEYAFKGGEQIAIAQLLDTVAKYKAHYVTVTGGEPLAQPDAHVLLTALCDNGYTVSLETSGAFDISMVDKRVYKIVDFKAPGSKEEQQNRWENLGHVQATDELKFVLADKADFDWAIAKIKQYNLLSLTPNILFSPVYETLNPKQLADWVLESELPIRFQLQLHKQLWGEQPGV